MALSIFESTISKYKNNKKKKKKSISNIWNQSVWKRMGIPQENYSNTVTQNT